MKRGSLCQCAVCGRRRTLRSLRRLLVDLTYPERQQFLAYGTSYVAAGQLVCRGHESAEEHQERMRHAGEIDELLAARPHPSPFPREQYDALIARQETERTRFFEPALAIPPVAPSPGAIR